MVYSERLYACLPPNVHPKKVKVARFGHRTFSRSHSISFVHIQKDLLRTVGHCGRGNRKPAPQEILYRSNLGWCLARVRTKIGRDGNVGVFIEIVAESD